MCQADKNLTDVTMYEAVELCLPSKYTYTILIQLFHPACDCWLWLLMSIASDDSDVSG